MKISLTKNNTTDVIRCIGMLTAVNGKPQPCLGFGFDKKFLDSFLKIGDSFITYDVVVIPT